MSLADYLRAMPKAELHVHLEGSIGPETLLELAEHAGVELPCATLEEARALYDFRDFEGFAEVLLLGATALVWPEDFALVVYRLGAEMARHNIRYAEVTWTPQFYVKRPSQLPLILEALNAGRARARAEWDVDMAWIPDLVRSVPQPMELVRRWACGEAARAGGVVALGLGGPEKDYPAGAFAGAFARARAAGLPANPHAGEGAGPESVWQAVRELGAARIGHGVRAVEESALLDYLAEHAIPLEVCPTSNVRLGVYGGYGDHPLRRLVEAGCMVTLNSDDPLLLGTTLSEEYRHAVEDCGLTLGQLEAVALNAVRASYLPEGEKAAMLAQFEAEYARLRAKHAIPCSR